MFSFLNIHSSYLFPVARFTANSNSAACHGDCPDSPFVIATSCTVSLQPATRLLPRHLQVDIADVIDGIYGADPATWRAMTPCYALRRLECRYQLKVQHAESLARCCRHLQHLCLRGRHSARNDLMMLHW